ncbi:type II toxin-antitoxin system ParD family antitoxin [Neptuniibacter sp.]|uniref:type II toxin-antitoxin system ParD family antitoxin n=1 Tax=Neptuniibacter sp. TaxID=1962643 RepID=UPI0026397FBC|nr:type II toxin-antitoxin system ParD family antitoxin [Neptuniibacter sp.]MCP4597505.1 type II toxin-antitoxin system ParD family antitoxin [Neptuniibacter sp.]
MNVSLTPKLEAFIKDKVESGSYNSSSEVVREALRLLEQRDAEERLKLETLRAEVQKGLDSLEEHGAKPLDIEAIKQQARL